MKKTKQRFSKLYISAKKQEYDREFKRLFDELNNEAIKRQMYRVISNKFVKYIKGLNDAEYSKLKVLPKSLLLNKLDKISNEFKVIYMNRYRKAITNIWVKMFELGTKHQVLDFLYTSGFFKKELDKVSKFSSLVHGSLIAEFAEGDTPEELDRKAIIRARVNLSKLKKNLDQLKSAGLYREVYRRGESKATRLTLEQKVKFLETIQEIADYSRKAQVSRSTFLSDNYIQNRIRVLTNDFGSQYDTYVKDQIYTYLSENIEGVNQIRNTFTREVTATDNIYNALVDSGEDDGRVSPIYRSERILRTELSLAYNFGKLAGFTSDRDLTKRFRWNADWELEGRSDDYVVCLPCADMDGTIWTVRQLLAIGTRLDRGVLRYRGVRGQTDFKNPTLPMIPFHPNCNCFWTYEDEGFQDPEQEQQVFEDYPELNPDTSTNLLTAAAITGLVVGGTFLLARSNAWKSFLTAGREVLESIGRKPIRTTTSVVETTVDNIDNVGVQINQSIPKTTPTTSIVDDLGDIVDDTVYVGDYVEENLPEEIANRFKEVVSTAIDSTP